MFEKIVIRRRENGLPISAGQLAEALLFYRKVHLVVDNGTMLELVRQIGVSQFLDVLRRSDVTAVHCEEHLATHTERIGVLEAHAFIAMKVVGHESVGVIASREGRVCRILERTGIPDNSRRQFAAEFVKRVPVREFSSDYFVRGGVTQAARQDLGDLKFMREALRVSLRRLPGGYDPGEALSIELIDSDIGFYAFSNIDFDRINASRSKISSSEEPSAMARLLSSVLDARADLALASHYGCDFSTSATTSDIIKIKCNELLIRSERNLEAREKFLDVVLPEAPSLAEVIDNGGRSFAEFLDLLKKAEAFKKWVHSTNVDRDLVSEYIRGLSSKGWLDTLPVKTVRYVLPMAIGKALGPGVGEIVEAGLSAADTFLVEKLAVGWRPGHFVDPKLSRFLSGP